MERSQRNDLVGILLEGGAILLVRGGIFFLFSIWTIVDRSSKYEHFVPFKHPYSTRSLDEIFASKLMKFTGIRSPS
jgi:hypothetical protein